MTYKIIVVFFSISAIIACMEILSRMDDYIRLSAPIMGEYSQESMLMVRDSNGTRGKPNGRFEKWKLNGFGFRGPEIQLEKPLNVIRIATMGASETFGIFETEGNEWPRSLQSNLNDVFPQLKFEVVNVAVPGMTLMDAHTFYQKFVRPIKPDILLLYVNTLPYLDSLIPIIQRKETPTNNLTNKKSKFNFKLGRPRLISKLSEAWRTRGPQAIVTYLEETQKNNRYNAFNQKVQYQNWDSTQADLLKMQLVEFVLSVKEDSIPIILSEHAHALSVWNPGSHSFGWLNLWKYRPRISVKAFGDGYPKLNEAIWQVGKEQGCDVVNQGNLLQEPDSNFAGDGLHFTNKGAKIAADNFFNALVPVITRIKSKPELLD